jgi:large subunit ribosomal protein L17
MKNLASSLLLTERDAEFDDSPPQVAGRVVTTMAKAKEVRPLVERCITIARHALDDQRRADALASDAERDSDEWRKWRTSDRWIEWNQAIAPVLTARRRVIRMLGNKEAVSILFDSVAPRFENRPGGYTRILQLANPRLGDAGTRVILEFVGERDRIKDATPEPVFVEEEETPATGLREQEEVAEDAMPKAANSDAGEEVAEDNETDSAESEVSEEN